MSITMIFSFLSPHKYLRGFKISFNDVDKVFTDIWASSAPESLILAIAIIKYDVNIFLSIH